MTGVVRCKHCEWSTPIWRKTANGRTVNGLDALHTHMRDKHAKEYDAIHQRVVRESIERFGELPEAAS